VLHYILYEFFLFMYLLLCVCFSWDLYQTIKNPLYPAEKRLKIYIIASILITFGLFCVEYYLIEGSIFVAFDLSDPAYDLSEYMDINRDKWKVLLIVPLVAQLLIGGFSCYKAYMSFHVPGVGQEVRIQVIKR
jgi:hypothetical protein